MGKMVAVVVAFAALFGGTGGPEPETTVLGTHDVRPRHVAAPVAPSTTAAAPAETVPAAAASTTAPSTAARRQVSPAPRPTAAPATTAVTTAPLPPALIVRPGLRHYNAGRGLPVVLSLHGAFEDPAEPVFPELLQGIADAGYEVIFSDLGGPNTWGNEQAMAAIADLKATYSPTRPVRLVAGSMGGIALLNYASGHPADVVAAVGIIPATNLHNVSLQHYIAMATPTPREPAQLVTVPYQVWYGTNDDVVGPPTIRGPLVEVHAMPTGHTAGQPVDMAAVIRFLARR